MPDQASRETSEGEILKLTRRRALGALGTVSIGGAIAGAGTFAAFTDSDAETGGFDVGTLELIVGDSSSLSFNAGDIKPGDSGTEYADLNKGGTLPGDLTPEVKITNKTAGENGTVDIDDHLEFQMWLDVGGSNDESYDDTEDVGLLSDGTTGSPTYDTVANYDGVSWNNAIEGMDSDWTFHLDWQLPDSDNVNDVQDDQIDIDFAFSLTSQ